MTNEARVRITGDASGWNRVVRTVDVSTGFLNLRQGITDLADKLGDPLNQAVALGESVNAVNAIFDDSAKTIIDWGESTASSFGLSQRAFQQLATPLGAVLKNAGLSLDETAEQTINLTERAADLASVFNTEVEDSLAAIQSGLIGQTEPLRKYGVNLTAAAVEARALADSGKSVARELTEQEKAAARLAIIFEQTADAEGDFRNTSDSLANAQRILNASLEDSRSEMVQRFLPAIEKGVAVFASLPPEVQAGTAALIEFAPAVAQTSVGLIAMAPAIGRVAGQLPAMAAAARGAIPALAALTVAVGALVAANELLGSNAPEWAGELARITDPTIRLARMQELAAESTGLVRQGLEEEIAKLEDAIEAERQAAATTERFNREKERQNELLRNNAIFWEEVGGEIVNVNAALRENIDLDRRRAGEFTDELSGDAGSLFEAFRGAEIDRNIADIADELRLIADPVVALARVEEELAGAHGREREELLAMQAELERDIELRNRAAAAIERYGTATQDAVAATTELNTLLSSSSTGGGTGTGDRILSDIQAANLNSTQAQGLLAQQVGARNSNELRALGLIDPSGNLTTQGAQQLVQTINVDVTGIGTLDTVAQQIAAIVARVLAQQQREAAAASGVR